MTTKTMKLYIYVHIRAVLGGRVSQDDATVSQHRARSPMQLCTLPNTLLVIARGYQAPNPLVIVYLGYRIIVEGGVKKQLLSEH